MRAVRAVAQSDVAVTQKGYAKDEFVAGHAGRRCLPAADLGYIAEAAEISA